MRIRVQLVVGWLVWGLVAVAGLGVDAHADVAGPGWLQGVASPVTPEAAEQYYAPPPAAPQALTVAYQALAAAAPETAPEIVALARAMQHDPQRIYEFVHNHIDYVPYFGALKGAVLTLTERAGNDFDQAALMIALLRASGFTAQFVYGQQFIPVAGAADQRDLQHWLGVDADAAVISRVLGSGGIPVNFGTSPPLVTRVWVRSTVDGADYLFDPEVAGKRLAITYDTGGAAAAAVATASTTAAGGPTPLLGGVSPAQLVALESGAAISPPLVGAPLSAEVQPSAPLSQSTLLEGGLGQEGSVGGPVSLAVVATWDFGWVTPSSGPSTFTKTFTNNNAFTITVTNSLLAGTSSAYSILQGGGTRSLTPGQSMTIQLQFSGVGQMRGTKTGTFRMRLSCSSCTPLDQDYALTGFVASAPNLTGSYGINVQTYLNQTIDATARLQNSGSLSLTINSIALTGTNAGRFQIVSGGGTGNVGAGGFRAITVRYLGTPRGTHTANLHITFTYDGISGYTVDLSLQGQTVLQPDLTGSLGVDFGPRYLGDLLDATATLKNSGTLNLTVNSVTLTGTDGVRFQLLSGTGAGTLSPGQSRAVGVRYRADAVGVHTPTTSSVVPPPTS